jgi:hypothetical protein
MSTRLHRRVAQEEEDAATLKLGPGWFNTLPKRPADEVYIS